MSSPMVTPVFTARSMGLPALGFSTLLPMLAGSMGNMALPALGVELAIPLASLQWVLVAYLLGITSLSVVAGRLGDRLGRRQLLCWGVVLFTLASLLCALAPSMGWLVAARALQGAGAACMLSLALAMVGRQVAPQRRGWGMGLLGTLSACGTALGPLMGGWLVDSLGWQAPFLLLVPLGLLALVLALLGLPADEAGPRGDGVRLGSLLPLALLREAPLRDGLLGSALVASVMVLTLLIGPFYLHGMFGLSLTEVGLWISGGPLLAACTGLPAGWLVDRLGSGAVLRIGLGGMLLATLGLVMLPTSWGPLGYLLPILLLTAGYALFQTANNGAVVGGAHERDRGAVAGLLTLARNLGQFGGAAGLGALFSALVGSEMGGASAMALRTGMQLSFVAAGLLLGLALWLNRRTG
ncbi:MFS transporter [Aeromonas veronii]|uniref:MFS transporter n=1 Tax=Aeromonas veronii TaxID=654 RepID=UPI0032EDABEC